MTSGLGSTDPQDRKTGMGVAADDKTNAVGEPLTHWCFTWVIRIARDRRERLRDRIATIAFCRSDFSDWVAGFKTEMLIFTRLTLINVACLPVWPFLRSHAPPITHPQHRHLAPM